MSNEIIQLILIGVHMVERWIHYVKMGVTEYSAQLMSILIPQHIAAKALQMAHIDIMQTVYNAMRNTFNPVLAVIVVLLAIIAIIIIVRVYKGK